MSNWKVLPLLSIAPLMLAAGMPRSIRPTATTKVVTITEMDYYSTLAAATLSNYEKLFEKSHPNIKIVREPEPYSDLLPKALQEATAHTLPTILISDNLNIPTMVQAGALVPITKFGAINRSQYLAGPIKTTIVNGKMYGLPVGSNDLALFYNKTMLAAAHLSPPKTWSQLLVDAKTLTHGHTFGFVFSAPNNEQGTWQFAPFLWTNGGSYTKFGSPESVAALTLWKNLVKEHGASQSVVNYSQTDVYDQFAAGNAAMMEMGPWEIPSLNKLTHINYGIANLPAPNLGQKVISPIGGEVWTITSDGTLAQQQAAATFIHWMQQKERLVTFDSSLGYIPTYKPATQLALTKNPKLKLFAQELNNAKPLFSGLGTNLPTVSTYVATAIATSVTGGNPTSAAKTAAASIDALLHP